MNKKFIILCGLFISINTNASVNEPCSKSLHQLLSTDIISDNITGKITNTIIKSEIYSSKKEAFKILSSTVAELYSSWIEWSKDLLPNLARDKSLNFNEILALFTHKIATPLKQESINNNLTKTLENILKGKNVLTFGPAFEFQEYYAILQKRLVDQINEMSDDDLKNARSLILDLIKSEKRRLNFAQTRLGKILNIGNDYQKYINASNAFNLWTMLPSRTNSLAEFKSILSIDAYRSNVITALTKSTYGKDLENVTELLVQNATSFELAHNFTKNNKLFRQNKVINKVIIDLQNENNANLDYYVFNTILSTRESENAITSYLNKNQVLHNYASAIIDNEAILQHPEWIKALFNKTAERKIDFLIKIVTGLGEHKIISKFPELVLSIVQGEHNFGNDALSIFQSYLIKYEDVSDYPQIVSTLINALDRPNNEYNLLGITQFTHPSVWIKNPELVEELISRNNTEKSLVQNIFSKEFMSNKADLFIKFLDKDRKNFNHAKQSKLFELDFWKNNSELQEYLNTHP